MTEKTKKCGFFRNRHKWEYYGRNLRICTKPACGLTERYVLTQDSSGAFCVWQYWPFDEWMREAAPYIQQMSEEQSKKEAQAWLKGRHPKGGMVI